MLAGFERVKTEYRRRMLISGIVGGVLFGLAVTGVLLIAFKLSAIVLGWYVYLLIGIGAAALCAALLCLLLKPDDVKLAKKLDKAYSLDEQAQTRVEYAAHDGAVVALQRQTTDNTLDNLPKRRPSAVSIVMQAVAVVVAVALFVSGIVVPQKRTEIIEEPPYTVDAIKIERLEELTENITNDTVIKASVQEAFVKELETLYTNLNSDNLDETAVTGYVQGCMRNISNIMIAANTYDDISRALTSCGDDVEYMAEAIRSSAKASGSDGANIDLTSYNNMGTAAQTKISTYVTSYMMDMGETFSAMITALTDDTVLDKLGAYISAFETVLKYNSLSDYYDALVTNGGLTFGSSRGNKYTSGDDLYNELYDLYCVLNETYTFYSRGDIKDGVDNVRTYINKECGGETETGTIYNYDFVRDGGTALQMQAYTYLSDAYIRYTLGDIFGVTVVGKTPDDGETDSSSGGSGESGGGSGGTGETIYPSDDMIYNPDTGEYTYYYEMLTSGYLAQLYELLESDDISEEVKNYIMAYIGELL